MTTYDYYLHLIERANENFVDSNGADMDFGSACAFEEAAELFARMNNLEQLPTMRQEFEREKCAEENSNIKEVLRA